ncbi:MAG TPA: hypothetical protein VJV23_12975 [Candidatus Polarisedimenticolia bacterium]|nr:hypothetical protein [Candidatus Polarisedimenticolia bacterium]
MTRAQASAFRSLTVVSAGLLCLLVSSGRAGAQGDPAPSLDPNGPPAAAAPPPSGPIIFPAWFDDPNASRQQDPKALEILKAGIAALGGEEAILGRRTIYMKRKVVNHDYPEPREGTITIWFKRPNLLRKEIAYPHGRHIEAFDGERAWFDSGAGPQRRGDVLTASVLNGMTELDAPANYLSADLTYFNISQEIPGKLAHVVKVRKNGYTRELMFDVTTSLLEVAGEYENPWGATDKMTKYERYRPVDGMMVPWKVLNYRANALVTETEILEIKFNEPIDDALFMFPAPASASAPSPAPR